MQGPVEMHMTVLQNPNLQLIKLASSNPRHQKSASRRWRLYTLLTGSLQMLISRQTGEINLVTILIRMLVKKPLSLLCLTEGPSIWFACLVAFYREEWEPAAKKDIWQTLHFKDVWRTDPTPGLCPMCSAMMPVNIVGGIWGTEMGGKRGDKVDGFEITSLVGLTLIQMCISCWHSDITWATHCESCPLQAS